MAKLLRAYVVYAVLLSATATTGLAQTMSPESMIRQILQTHIGPNGLPTDFVIQGQITDDTGMHALRMEVKGKNQIRYEQTQGTHTTIAIYNAGTAWATANLFSLAA